MSYQGDACVVGVGTNAEFGFDLEKSALSLQVEAFVQALDDAGLTREQVDGFATSQGSPNGVDYEEFVLATGLECRWVSQMWAHGRWATTSLAQVALVVSAGLADYVVVANTSMSPRGFRRYFDRGTARISEGLRDVGGGRGEWDVHGIDTPGTATSLVARRYMDRYGASEDDLATITVGFRAHALRNPIAVMRDKPMDEAGYFAEPVIAAPFRRPDFSLTNDGSTCLIVTSEERARDLPGPMVRIAGFEGLHVSRDDYIMFGRPGLGVGISREHPWAAPAEPLAYRRAGITREDVAGLYMYDSFSSNLWMVLERFGFCAEGEAPGYISDVGIGLDSALPVNTNGGLLSEGHLAGYAHLVEMVRQLRGQAGERQLTEPRAVQWATPWGDTLVLTAG